MQLQGRYIEGQQDLHDCVFIDLEKSYDRVPREELYWCTRDKGVPEKYISSGSFTPPRICFQPFPVCHHDGFIDGKHLEKSTLADDVRR